jgi:hypothetical protein
MKVAYGKYSKWYKPSDHMVIGCSTKEKSILILPSLLDITWYIASIKEYQMLIKNIFEAIKIENKT